MVAIRNPIVAGQFYPGSKDLLLKELKSLISKALKSEQNAIGILSPHAGYIYSGHVAGGVFGSIRPKATYVILGPNHTGMGEDFGLSTDASWMTPIGEARIDKILANQIKKNSKYVKEDDLPHAHEHSIEVQLPFLQFIQSDFKFVPIVVSAASLDIYREVGSAIARSIMDLKMEKDITIIASSDMTHYESQENAKMKDSVAIEAILELNEEKLLDRISNLDISMCGYGPAAIMIVAAKELGAKSSRLVNYETSGAASGDYSSVVGYAGIIIS